MELNADEARRRARAWIKRQRDSLINMTRTNRLLYFKHTKAASLEITGPAPVDILNGLNRSGAKSGWSFPPLTDEDTLDKAPGPNQLVIPGKEPAQLERALRLLERKTNEEYVERGLWVLHLGLGMLNWAESKDVPVSSPLLLVPVTIARSSLKEPYRLRRVEEDVVVNPALAVKLANDFGITLPPIDTFEETGLNALLAEVEKAVRDQSTWSVSRRVVLSTFTFQKEVMYRDLLDNEDQLAADPIIQLLSLGPEAPSAGSFDFESVTQEQLDTAVPPEDLVSVKDADASQRTCILAARDGRSFVMDGPPGSGKSQTITNIIAELLHAGKTVLFVSEKAAALEVVHNRLRKANLDDFVLQLHSHNANRKTVATGLGKALAQKPTAIDSFSETSRSELTRRRKALSQYAHALNELRQPLGRSLHDVLGAIGRLQNVPQAPVPTSFGQRLQPGKFTELLDNAATLGRAWGPVTRGRDFLWRDLENVQLSAARRKEIDHMLKQATERLGGLRELVSVIDEDFGLGWHQTPGDGWRLLSLTELLNQHHDIPVDWLSRTTLDDVHAKLEELKANADLHTTTVAELKDLIGPDAADLDTELGIRLDSALRTLSQEHPALYLPPNIEAGQARQVAEFLKNSQATLTEIANDADTLCAAFGIPVDGLTLARASELAELGMLAGSADRPEVTWLNPALQTALDQAVSILGTLLGNVRSRQQALRETFTDDVLTLDLPGLDARFKTVHRGLRKLGGKYRADKKTLAACTVSGRVDRTVLARLPEAIAWQQLTQQLSTAESRYAPTLGNYYYQRQDTDFSHISHAIEVARKALRLADTEIDSTALAEQVAREGSPDPRVIPAAERLARRIQGWLSEALQVHENPQKKYGRLPIRQLLAWCKRTATEMQVVTEVIDEVSAVSGRPATLAVTVQALRLADEIVRLRELVDGTTDADRRLLGPSYSGLSTPWPKIDDAVTWTSDVRGLLGGPVNRHIAEALLNARNAPNALRHRLDAWTSSEEEIVSKFATGRADEIKEELTDSFSSAEDLIRELSSTVGDIEEWATHEQARVFLDKHGLGAVVEFCATVAVPGDQVRLIFERAILEAWADDVLNSDKTRLSPTRALERDALVEEFRELDRKQVSYASARVVNACSQRRPTSTAGAGAVIQRQSQLQRRHMSIRKLLDETGSVAQRLKPCFMMSPLSVSQYLPPGLRFDVVVFDEASQLLPSDSINCLYRAKQHIVAGDQKQLPPTNFFSTAAAADDDPYDEDQVEEFESLLDLCKGAGALRSLPLNWHYRSQHEDLITYSNYRFYEGTLHTFPSASPESPDSGLELFKVDGVYRRGDARDNPVEARTVIDRVLHHRKLHPDRTLGVVTFSGAQQDAIQHELERRAAHHPELGDLPNDDRLDGFFVKNLENVQGDERDIIIFSIGYGPDEHGKFYLNLGPLTRPTGWRRLNVAITRAKRRVEIVTSVLADQFPGTATSTGIQHLRGYLDFADRGIKALARDLDDSLGEAESPFEEEVIRLVEGWGYQVVPQIGEAGYRIDMAVRDPGRPGRYVLGIECDGAMYHSSKVARDRDRLRQQVLEGLGWRIHRIWGTAWYHDRTGQEARLRKAIEVAIATADSPVASAPVIEVPAVAHEEIDFEAAPTWTIPYELVALDPVNTSFEIHQPEARRLLRRLIKEVVDQEGPVHEDRVLKTVRKAWGKGRSGSRIREAFDDAARGVDGLLKDDYGFLRFGSTSLQNVRVPTEDPDTQREIRHVPQLELCHAIWNIVNDAHSISRDALTTRVSRLFGWQRRGPDIRADLENAVSVLISAGELSLSGDQLSSAESEAD
jgi:very-short-patch-repair endonuclease